MFPRFKIFGKLINNFSSNGSPVCTLGRFDSSPSANPELANTDAALKPEMFANFRILTSDSSDAPGVPEAAVVYEGEAAHVWVLSADGLLAYRAIRTGRSSDGLVEVLDGLKPGEKVVTKGGLFIDQVAAPASS